MSTTLRPYQEELKPQIYSAWNAGHKNVLLVLPTGGGKTKLFCSITIDMAIDPKGPRYPTVIMVHRKELVQQISLTLAEEGIVHNIIAPRGVILGIVAAQRQLLKKQFYDYNATVSVVSVDTLNARFDRHEKWAKTIKFWITDEAAHLLAANKWGKAVSYFPDAIGLGVTATPKRLDKRGLGRHADGVFDVKVEGPGTRWLINEGYLSPYKVAVPEGDYQQYLKKATDGSDYSREAMAAASSQSHIVGDAVKSYIKLAHGKQAIYFTDGIESGEKLEKAFCKKGINAKLLTGMTDDKERLKALIDFRDKKIQVLVNIDLFDEGLDVPGIEVVGMCRPTMSTGKFLQQIGRGLRPAKGKKFCIIIDHVGNVMTHGVPCTPRQWTLDRIVKRQDKTNLIRICGNHECNSPYDRILTECPYCGWHPVASKSRGETSRLSLAQVDGDLQLLDPETLRAMYEEATLEDPGKLAHRVSMAAGPAAGIKAMKNQIERIATQVELAEVIAKYAGKKKQHGYTDRQIHKAFFLEFSMTITVALSQTRADMSTMMEDLKERYRI